MKIVRVSGGLGNQMFQYAFARALELDRGEEVFLDLTAYGYEPAHNGFELDRLFPVRYRAASERDIERLGTRPRDRISKLRRKFLTKPSHHIDRVFRFDEAVLALEGDRYLEGWWQTEKYFPAATGILRGEFEFLGDPGERNRRLLGELEGKAERSLVSLHVRRGDALRNPDTLVCTEGYYRRAVARAAEGGGKPRFLVFSDDLPWCRANLGLPEDAAVFVDWNRGEDSWRDMWLMSRCASHIVANSTFSWWGAWLDPSPDKRVFAPEVWSLARPRPWSYYRYSFEDIVPPSWTRISIA